MKLEPYKPALLILAFFIACTAAIAQTVSVKTKPSVSVTTNFDDKDFQLKMDNLGRSLSADLNDLGKNISATINNITSNIHINVNDADEDAEVKVNPEM